MLRSLADGLWTLDHAVRNLGVEMAIRMTVVRLSSGELLLHSPVTLAPDTVGTLETLGKVRFILAPNRWHHLFVGGCREAFPQAELWAAPGLSEKRPDLAFHGVLGEAPEAGWADDLEQLVFWAMPIFNEVIFLHRATRTLILSDLVFNMHHVAAWPLRLYLRLAGSYQRFGPSRLTKRFIRDRPGARRAIDRILRWDFERVIMAHGDILEQGGPEAMRAAFSWL